MHQYFRIITVALGVLTFTFPAFSQDSIQGSHWLEPALHFKPARFWPVAATGTAVYTGTLFGLSHAWYADYERRSFHFFNDWNEWGNVDKMGHAFAAYFTSEWSFYAFRWTGMERRKAAWAGVGTSLLFLSSIEVLDAFSEKWGFSVADMGFNLGGGALFIGQELMWKEQKIRLKFSAHLPSYPNLSALSLEGNEPLPLHVRRDELFGRSWPERILKDYNGQTIWLSANLSSLVSNENSLPAWLNLAAGYGAQNMAGGFENRWEKDGISYSLSSSIYPRYQQFYISPDIDLSRLKVKSPFWRLVLGAFNALKVPAPALEWNTRGRLKFHPVYF